MGARTVRYYRHYIQFRDLVFDAIGLIEEEDVDVSFKLRSTEYSFTHGSYVPLKRKYALVRAGSVSMTVTFKMRKLPCEDRPHFLQFVKSELTQPGKLWAIEDNRLIWTQAIPSAYHSQVNARKDEFEIDIDFVLPEGIWHKPDKLRTFLVPYDVCEFMECYDFKDYNPCHGTSPDDCCNCSAQEPEGICDCCDPCDAVQPENALCYFTDLQDFYDCGGAGFKIIYSCEAAEKFFGDPLSNTPIGQKFCNPCGNLISGRFYSDTDIPTEDITIRLHGTLHNPYVEINGNGNIIQGDYEGTLDIHSNGEVYYYNDDGCICDEPLDVTRWIVPDGMTYGWEVQPGANRFIVDGGTCCALCAYFIDGAITI